MDELILFWIGVFFAGMWVLTSFQKRKLEKQLWDLLTDRAGGRERTADVTPAFGSRRVELIESQLDQIASQVDRLAETQEFFSRVLTDRIEHLPDPRMRTPH